MKIEQSFKVDYDAVDTDFRLKLPVLFQWLQRAALNHSETVGLKSEQMVADGGVWILSRIRLEIFRMPVFRDSITIRTWHKGSVGFRAERDFLLLRNDQPVAAAASQWLFYDLKRKRIVKIPGHISAPYTVEKTDALPPAAIDFVVDKTFTPSKTIAITTREGDFDPNGHVNNTIYLEYLNTVIRRSYPESGPLCRVGIQYLKEIGREIETLQAGLATTDSGFQFRFFDGGLVFAAGFATLDDRGA